MQRFFKKNIIAIVILSMIAVGAIGGGVYYYLQYRKTLDLLKNPTLAAQVEVQNLIAKVGQLIDLPKDEQPTIATVSDYKKLKDQLFFKNAKNGDKVLIYTRAKKAILYDPVVNKIVEVAPLNIGEPTITPVQMRVALYNGTTKVGLTNTVEQELKSKITNINVISKDSATKSNYTKTLVIDINGNQATAVSQLAQILGGEVSPLPASEIKAKDADILVIIGNK